MAANSKPLRVADYDDSDCTYVDSLVQVAEFGPVTHLAFAMSRHCVGTPEGERRVVARLIVPTVCLPQIIRQLANGPVAAAESDAAMASAETQSVH
jgi:hypothetical protein